MQCQRSVDHQTCDTRKRARSGIQSVLFGKRAFSEAIVTKQFDIRRLAARVIPWTWGIPMSNAVRGEGTERCMLLTIVCRAGKEEDGKPRDMALDTYNQQHLMSVVLAGPLGSG
jgi:hypothetical protein